MLIWLMNDLFCFPVQEYWIDSAGQVFVELKKELACSMSGGFRPLGKV